MGAGSRLRRKERKEKERRDIKAKKKAYYQSLAGTGANYKRKQLNKSRHAKKGLRRRDDNCQNIGDLTHHPEQAPGLYKLWYAGRFQKLMDNELPLNSRKHHSSGTITRYKGVMSMVHKAVRDPIFTNRDEIIQKTKVFLRNR